MTTNSLDEEKFLDKTSKHILVKQSEKESLYSDKPHIPGEYEIHSTKKGLFNQMLVTGAVLILAAGCGMPIGYSAVLLPQLYNSTDPLTMDIEMGSWFASIHSLATPVGSFASGPIADKFGRRPALLLSIFPLLTGWTMLATAQSHAWLIAGRLIAGAAVGLIGAPAQILIAEIAEPRIRGMLIGAPFVSYSLGILFVYTLGSTLHWRTVAWWGTVLPLLSAIALFLSPESPTWLARGGHIERASKALSWLRGDDQSAKRELSGLVERFELEKASAKSTDNFIRLCCARPTLKPLIIINVFHILQILSGTFLVVFYAVDIVSEFGTQINSISAAVMTAIVRLICTMIFCFLLLVMRRRSMVIFSGIGSGLSALTLGIYMIARLGQPKTSMDIYISGFCILSYIACNTGFMAMPGIMIGELLPGKIRGRIAGYVFAAFNIMLFGLTKIFPYLQMTFKTHGLFIMFGLASFGASLLMYLMLPETKTMTLGQIEDYFRKDNWLWIRRKREIRGSRDVPSA